MAVRSLELIGAVKAAIRAWEQPEMFPDEACAGFRILR